VTATAFADYLRRIRDKDHPRALAVLRAELDRVRQLRRHQLDAATLYRWERRREGQHARRVKREGADPG
jgi:hypothetical protein